MAQLREQGRGWLMQYLPEIYRQRTDPTQRPFQKERTEPEELPFLERFLRGFELIWEPLDVQLDQIDIYFRPELTPADFLPWLGAWLDLTLDENWPEARRRELVRRAAELYRRRGTAEALRDYLEIYTGHRPIIAEDEEDDTFHFTVIFNSPLADYVTQDRIRRIIDESKPVHTVYTLQLPKL